MDPCGKGVCSHLGHPGAALCPWGPPEPHCKSLCPSCVSRNCEIFTRQFRMGGLSPFLLLEPEK